MSTAIMPNGSVKLVVRSGARAIVVRGFPPKPGRPPTVNVTTLDANDCELSAFGMHEGSATVLLGVLLRAYEHAFGRAFQAREGGPDEPRGTP